MGIGGRESLTRNVDKIWDDGKYLTFCWVINHWIRGWLKMNIEGLEMICWA